ncbi:VOC family protein [Streptomyces sp. NPDC058240]|uniref:VOC family protein n=1 Tax=Streptomyces sp. NPDC058240 TaxID=3346396 RepID=UPI0036ED34F0
MIRTKDPKGCPDPAALAGFYAGLLGGEIVHDGEGWAELTGVAGTLLAFQAAPGLVPPRWPSADSSQQVHLDLTVADLTVEDRDAAEKEALALGATVLDAENQERSFRVYADPAGHPFCLCACQ